MRRPVLSLLASALILVLALSLAACTPSAAPTPSPTDEPTADPTAEPTPDVPDDYLAVYARFLGESLVVSPYFSPYGDPAWAIVLGDTLTGIDEETVSDMYWCTEYAIVDLDFDGAPELIINFGEVERTMFVFTVDGDTVKFLFSCLSGNQDFTDAVSLYTDAAGTKLWVSEGLSGSGAGGYYELGYIEGMTYTAQRTRLSSVGSDTKYTVLGAAADEASFNAVADAFSAAWTLDTRYDFALIGSDGAAAINAALASELQLRYPDWSPAA